MKNYDDERIKYIYLHEYTQQSGAWSLFSLVFTVLLIVALLKYILICFVALLIFAIVFAFVKNLIQKRMYSSQAIVITPEEAVSGTEVEVYVRNIKSPVTFNVKIFPNIKNGQKIIVKNIEMENESGEKYKKDICIRVEIKE